MKVDKLLKHNVCVRRAFEMPVGLAENDQQHVLTFERPLNCMGCCCKCCYPSCMQVSSGSTMKA
jgi:hypothetical protein